jgi:hypothetical protein
LLRDRMPGADSQESRKNSSFELLNLACGVPPLVHLPEQ